MHRAKDLQGKEVKGYYCKVQGRHYMVLEDAQYNPSFNRRPNTCMMDSPPTIQGFVEIDPKTLVQENEDVV